MSGNTDSTVSEYLEELHEQDPELTKFLRDVKYEKEKRGRDFTEIQDNIFFELEDPRPNQDAVNVGPHIIQGIVFGILWEQATDGGMEP